MIDPNYFQRKKPELSWVKYGVGITLFGRLDEQQENRVIALLHPAASAEAILSKEMYAGESVVSCSDEAMYTVKSVSTPTGFYLLPSNLSAPREIRWTDLWRKAGEDFAAKRKAWEERVSPIAEWIKRKLGGSDE